MQRIFAINKTICGSMGEISQIGSLASTDQLSNENFEKEAYCVHSNKSMVMNDISIHPTHGKFIMLLANTLLGSPKIE